MNTITLNDDQLLLIIDIISRAQDDFDPHLYGETEIEGYASVCMFPMSEPFAVGTVMCRRP